MFLKNTWKWFLQATRYCSMEVVFFWGGGRERVHPIKTGTNPVLKFCIPNVTGIGTDNGEWRALARVSKFIIGQQMVLFIHGFDYPLVSNPWCQANQYPLDTTSSHVHVQHFSISADFGIHKSPLDPKAQLFRWTLILFPEPPWRLKNRGNEIHNLRHL